LAQKRDEKSANRPDPGGDAKKGRNEISVAGQERVRGEWG